MYHIAVHIYLHLDVPFEHLRILHWEGPETWKSSKHPAVFEATTFICTFIWVEVVGEELVCAGEP